MVNTSKVVALAFLPLLLATQCPEAAETTLINFSCDGKMTGPLIGQGKSEPVNNVGLVVNFIEKTVSFAGFVASFQKVDAANVNFSSTNQGQYGNTTTVDGSLDRVTGAFAATTISMAGSRVLTSFYWDMLCKPTSRLF